MSSEEIVSLSPNPHTDAGMERYDAHYAERYIRTTLGSPYNEYKNSTLAGLIARMGFKHIVDIGSNVSGMIKRKGSLRYQAELHDITYTGVDVDEDYFNLENAKKLGTPKEEIYPSIDYRVASVEDMPFEDASIDALVCADVIEHVPDASQAFREIARTLNPKEGRAFMVIPSMYKLDLFDFKYIDEKRRSSHDHKLSAKEWEKMWEDAGLIVDWENSRPIGIASGLSYLSWLNDDFVPQRENFDSKQQFSEKSLIHRGAKEVFATHDAEIDSLILTHGIDKKLGTSLKDGDVHGAFLILQDIISNNVQLSDDEKRVLDLFFSTERKNNFDEKRIEQVCETFGMAENSNLLLGNSMLVVLKHPQ